jgi:hypothetical protein
LYHPLDLKAQFKIVNGDDGFFLALGRPRRLRGGTEPAFAIVS